MFTAEVFRHASASAVIQERVQLAPELYYLRFSVDMQTAQPGQYCMVGLPRFDEKPFMIAASNPLQLIVKRSGPFTTLLTDATLGAQRCTIRGPFGHGFRLPEILEANCSIFIDSVAGLAAGTFLLEKLLQMGCTQLYLHLGEQWLHVATAFLDRNSIHSAQLIQYTNDRFAIPSATEYLYLAAGFSQTVAELVPYVVGSTETDLIVSAQGIFTNAYIACAMGLCGRCAQPGFLSGKLLCTEGPVIEVQIERMVRKIVS